MSYSIKVFTTTTARIQRRGRVLTCRATGRQLCNVARDEIERFRDDSIATCTGADFAVEGSPDFDHSTAKKIVGLGRALRQTSFKKGAMQQGLMAVAAIYDCWPALSAERKALLLPFLCAFINAYRGMRATQREMRVGRIDALLALASALYQSASASLRSAVLRRDRCATMLTQSIRPSDAFAGAICQRLIHSA